MGMLLSTRRALLGGGLGVPTVNFDPSLVTFTAKMAKRTAPGPFAAAPIVQGKWAEDGTTGDKVTVARGSQISGNFYANIDQYQGSIVFWITPEWDGDDGKNHYILQSIGNTIQVLKNTSDQLQLNILGSTIIQHVVDISSWTAGMTYFIVCRWDFNNTLDGTNYVCISTNDAHAFGDTTAATASTPGTPIYYGSKQTSDYQADSILEGFTIYRRPLYDGANGVDAGNGDEINLIHASGAGKKPEEVTGADDICMQLATNGTAEELATGTGEAWSWSWSDNELTNWHLQADTAGAPDNWTNIGVATLANAATADILFDTRSQKITVDAADEGIRGDTTPSAGEDKSVWAWVKTGGAGQGVDLRIYDADGAADIVEMTTDATAWTLFNTCYEVPAGCSNVQHFIESTDADAYDMHVGQVQVLPNLVVNGGMEGTYDDEAGGGGGTIDVAPGWNNYNCETDGTDTLDESADAHSGSKSQQINVDANTEGIVTAANCFTANKWHLITVWIKGTSGSVRLQDSGGGAFLSDTIPSPAASWNQYSFVKYSTSTFGLRVVSAGGAADFLVDDISVIELDDVSLTVTPASEANSTENGGLRVDGRDTCTQDITGQLGAKSGKIRFNWTPRHGHGDWLKFNNAAHLCQIYNDADNRIYCVFAATSLTLFCKVGGVADDDSFSTNGVFVAGTEALIEIEYNGTDCTISVDGVVKATASPAGGIDFGANIPDTFYAHHSNNSAQSDAVYASP